MKFDPPADALASINTTRAYARLSTENGVVTNKTGTFTIRVTSAGTNALLGQQSFGDTIKGDDFYDQNPNAVHNWLAGFSQYGGQNVNVSITTRDINFTPTVQSGTATIGFAAKYEGFTYGGAAARIAIINNKCPPSNRYCQPE